MFKEFAKVVNEQFNKIAKHDLYRVDISKDELYKAYLDAYPKGTNEIYRENRKYDCNSCSQFIKRVGNVVAIIDNKIVSIWDVTVDGYYQEVANKLNALITSKPIRTKFLYNEKNISVESNYEIDENGKELTKWHHFWCKIPDRFVKIDYGGILSELNSTKSVFERGLNELTTEAINTTLDLINSGLYRGEEFKNIVNGFKTLKNKYDKIENKLDKQIFIWDNVKKLGSRIRNSSIGTLIQDLSNGVDLEKAVSSFESKVSSGNYKRTNKVITPLMIKSATEKIVELGIESALHRRYAQIGDVSINNVLFADRDVKPKMKDSLESLLLSEVQPKPINFNNTDEVTIKDFIDNILPETESIEVYFGNEHKANLFSLIAPIDKKSKKIFQWDNMFNWSYNGDVTDSMRDAVVAAGGRVDGDFRFTHSWNHDGLNQSLMDLHVFFPNNNRRHKDGTLDDREINDEYGNNQRVGWNHRKHKKTKGVQDVDFVNPPGNNIPLENITFPDKRLMPEGTYTLKIHNWNRRKNKGKGFKAEVEFDGQLFQYEYDKEIKNKEWITIARVTLKNGKFSIEHVLPSSKSSQDIWGIKTESFVKVSNIMLSPNHWDNQEIGNKHYFFILNECINPDETRGFYNEHLNNSFMKHRKVFDVLGNKMKCKISNDQLSGIGFSSTLRNTLVCKIKGKYNRVIKLKF